ncbi:AraC family transcriptional regulator [Aliikangiella coralliicola]|uniref:AraC family transcriptional regulator n=1 Tax=Aliikangiella coralliicola TaxID=2592383 RepID=A0A545U014_9GAMM|nr:AraC family transcriptional regulator [Aliikangiella coralliicola]TQV82805.1 AraC family transcriptional regulator [Aliikangiella coralliicola]
MNKIILSFWVVLSTISFTAETVEPKNTDNSNPSAEDVGSERSHNQSEQEALATLRKVSAGLQSLKKDVVSLNKELRLTEEKILYPSSTKFTVFVSLTTGQFFKLESLKLKLDGELVTSHVYSENQRQAMARGGIQKLYLTNLSPGKHNVTAFFTGTDVNGRAQKLAETLDFEKGQAGEYLEIAIRDNGDTQEPVFKMKRW